MSERVQLTEVIGTSATSWEEAGEAIRTAAAATIRDLQLAEVRCRTCTLTRAGRSPTHQASALVQIRTRALNSWPVFPVDGGSVRHSRAAPPHAWTAHTHTSSNAQEYPRDQQVTGQAYFWPLQG